MELNQFMKRFFAVIVVVVIVGCALNGSLTDYLVAVNKLTGAHIF